MEHQIFCCDGCQTQNFHGRRFHCLRCVNYDLCGYCYDQHMETLDHRAEHPMQLLIEQDRLPPPHSDSHPLPQTHQQHHHQQQQQLLPEVLLNGDLLELIHFPNCYTCPYCGIFGHTAKELIDHVVTMHRQCDNHVVCPMCASLPGIELVTIRNLARHLLLNHIEHANLLDPNTPPLRHSMTSRISRRRRRQQLVSSSGNQGNRASAAAAARMSRLDNPRIDSEAGIDILYQLSELRRLRPELRLSQTPANYLEGETTRLIRPTPLAIASSEAMANNPSNVPGCTNEGDLDLAAAQTSSELCDTADRFLLHQWMAEQSVDPETTLHDSSLQRRERHAHFAEHLLLSMLCDEHLQLPHKYTKQQQKHLHLIDGAFLLGTHESDHEDDVHSLGHCDYCPSQIMMLMSLPWIRPWSGQSKMRYVELQGVTLDESAVNGSSITNVQQDID